MISVAWLRPRCRGAARPGPPRDVGDAVTRLAVPGLDNAPTTHARLLAWVQEMAELTTPDRVVWVRRFSDESGSG